MSIVPCIFLFWLGLVSLPYCCVVLLLYLFSPENMVKGYIYVRVNIDICSYVVVLDASSWTSYLHLFVSTLMLDMDC